jgi:hypothetical protein
MFGAFPLGTACKGETYSLLGCREYATKLMPTIMTIDKPPNAFLLIMALSSSYSNSLPLTSVKRFRALSTLAVAGS